MTGRLTFALLTTALLACVAWSAAPGVEVAPHSLLTDDPGKLHIDLWGWETTPTYQRKAPVTPDYLVHRAVDESFRWGANLVEVYPGGYPLVRREGWSAESNAQFHREIHARDMQVHWFPHSIQSQTFASSIRALVSLFGSQFDALSAPPEERIDGMGSEHWQTMTPMLFNLCVWPYSPATYFYTIHHRYSETLPNEADCSASSGIGSDDQTSDYTAFPMLERGYFKLYDERRKRYGFQFWGSQAECRSAPAGTFGGLGKPDWILKQLNDQFRARALARGRWNVSPSALWWINEAEDMCREENRRYVYGTSLDPIRCAVAAQLLATGRDSIGIGEATTAMAIGRRQSPSRFPHPNPTAFIQNNYLRLYHLHDRDATQLCVDPQRLAHYDGDSRAFTLSESLLETLLPNGAPLKAASVEFDFPEPAGYVAELVARLQLRHGDTLRTEERRFTVYNDVPYLNVRIHRREGGCTTRLRLDGYDKIISVARDVFALSDGRGKLPPLAVFLLDRGAGVEVSPRPGFGLEFLGTPGGQDALEIGILLPDGLYTRDDYPELLDYFRKPPERVELDGDGRAIISNPYGFPLTHLVQVENPSGAPYQVFEYGRWAHRGAHPSLRHAGTDYLKCYLPAHGTAEIQKYGFLRGVARPGWGCQYTTALSNLHRTGATVSLTVEVKEITSFLFAPRVRFASGVKQARLNGRDWRYFDGSHVFLPNRRGRYQLVVEEGEDAAPRLCQTFACIDAARWDGEALVFEADLPPWSEGVPDDFYFHALVRHAGRALTRFWMGPSACGARPGEATVVRFRTGRIALRFDASAPVRPIPSVDAQAELEAHLRRKTADETLAYLEPFRPRTLRIGDRAGMERLTRDDVLVWNYYFLEEIPATLRAEAVAVLAEHLRRGGRALLLSNATRVLPDLLGIADAPPTTTTLRTSYRDNIVWVGVDAMAARGLLAGLRPSEGGYPLIEPSRFDVVKRVLWASETAILRDATPLAWFAVGYKQPQAGILAAEAADPVLWEYSLGGGRLAAYSLSLRYGLGTVDRRPPSANERRFVENVVRRLAPGADRPRATVLW
ncbi:hypothetical protein HS125_06585 [bacterium]|nr:hypothetical protein [bacterium]